MRRLAILVLAVMLLPLPAVAQDDVPNVLAWTGTYGFRHPSITDAQLALLELANDGAMTVTITENPAMLTAAILADYDVLMWVSTTGKPPLTDQQQADIIRFAGCGGGTVGFHAALDSNYGWADYAELFGAQFDSHPQNAGAGAARMIVEDDAHPITEGWQGLDSFMFDDEYYRWRSAKDVEGVSNPRNFGDTHVLLSLDETTVAEGIQDGPTPYEHHQPIAWTKTFRDRGRVYYNNMGHSSTTWSLPEFRTALINGVAHVSEVPLDLACFEGADPLPPAPTPPAADLSLVGQACTIPELLERSNGTWENSGPARALTADGDSEAINGGILGGLAWGAQTWILDLSDVPAATAEVTLTLEIPNPADDYDLGVTTAWGWYGSDAAAGVTGETVTISDVPHCAYLHVSGNNMAASGSAAPTLVAAVVPNPIPDPGPTPDAVPTPDPGQALATRLVADSDATVALGAAWSGQVDAVACACALLARDDDFADALSSGFAQTDGAPLLLTDGQALTASTAATIQRLGIREVQVLGGPAAVSEGVLDDLRQRGLTVSRVFGPTRIDTAVEIARAGAPRQAPLLLRAYGTADDATAGFADSLAAGRQAAADGRPVLLTDSDTLSAQVAAYLTDTDTAEVVIVGGTQAVSDQVVSDLRAMDITVRRVAGATRVETAVAVATELAGAADAMAAGGVLLIDGMAPTTWAEGFVAAGASQAGPIMLSDGDDVPAATMGWIGQADGSTPLICGALVTTSACDTAAAALSLG